MSVQDEVIAAADDILGKTTQGLTKEALARQVLSRLSRKILPAQVIDFLRKAPQRFVEGGDGRWRLRSQVVTLLDTLADTVEAPDTALSTESKGIAAATLRQGCYVLFDLETIGG